MDMGWLSKCYEVTMLTVSETGGARKTAKLDSVVRGISLRMVHQSDRSVAHKSFPVGISDLPKWGSASRKTLVIFVVGVCSVCSH
jgi:hypothetical protein